MILVELRYVLDDSQGTHKVGCALDHSILWPPRHDTDPSIRPEIPSLQNPGTHALIGGKTGFLCFSQQPFVCVPKLTSMITVPNSTETGSLAIVASR